MRTYLINYEPFYPNNFIVGALLFERIKKTGNWAKIGRNSWLVKSSYLSSDLLNFYRPAINNQDKLIVIEINKDWTAYNFSKEVIDWMRD